jgi:hypothetical protein
VKSVPVALLMLFRSPPPRPKREQGHTPDDGSQCRESDPDEPESGPMSMRGRDLKKAGVGCDRR